jgi:hypothetical protein
VFITPAFRAQQTLKEIGFSLQQNHIHNRRKKLIATIIK